MKQFLLEKQFVRFCAVGVANTIVYFVVYYSIVAINQSFYIVANIIGYVISVLNAWFWSSKYVFKNTQRSSLTTILKTYITYGITSLLSTFILYLEVEILKVSAFIAPYITFLFTVPINFLINKYWSFK